MARLEPSHAIGASPPPDKCSWPPCHALAAAWLVVLTTQPARATTLEPRLTVVGTEVGTVRVRSPGATWHPAAWGELDGATIEPGHHEIRLDADGGTDGAHIEVPHCAGRERIVIDGREVLAGAGTVIAAVPAGMHDVRIAVNVSGYERRIACGDAPRIGRVVRSLEGLSVLDFPSPSRSRGGGRAVVYIPPHHDPRTPGPLLVGLHPWNGSMWTYAAYAALLREASARDVVLLLPSGLGNSLYTSEAEDEVLRAIAAVSERLAVDPRAVSLWGASMGGAGATTIGFHRPDRFASITSFFGDSRYDTSTYVRSILPNDAAAHKVNALDVADNARHLSVWLIHGEDDRTSPRRQSEMLSRALQDRGYRVRFDRVAHAGHSGALVARFLPELVAIAATARVPDPVTRVTYRSVRASDTEAYGVRIVRAADRGDAFVDVERLDDVVRIRRAEGVRAVVISRGSLGTDRNRPPPILKEVPAVAARWEAGP